MKFIVLMSVLCAGVFTANAFAVGDEDAETVEKDSPWLLVPTLSSNPKLGTSIGGMAGYLVKFDEESPTSTFAAMGSYSDTDSSVYGLFAKTYFGGDRHRIIAGGLGTKIENQYEDFLGTGFQVDTADEISFNFLRYTMRTKRNWYLGAQLTTMDYAITAKNESSQEILDAVGLSGFKSNGIGLVLERDSRDTQNSPLSGSLLSFNNVAYREDLGGDVSFDVYSLNYSSFIGHGNGHVFATQVKGRWTSDAPVSGYSSVGLRGYTQGEYLAPNSTFIQIEERYAINEKWGLTAFLGASFLYGNEDEESDDWYPAGGGGITYMLKPKSRMVVRAEVAVGREDNYGVYIQFGNSF